MKISYEYDKNNRVVKITNSKGMNNLSTLNYTYDQAGRLTKEEAPGYTTTYTYDHVGNRIIKQSAYNSLQPTSFEYTDTGEIASYKTQKSYYIYNEADQLIKTTEKMYDEAGVELLKKKTTFTYDSNGNQTSQYSNFIHPYRITMRQKVKGEAMKEEVTVEGISTLIDRVTYSYDGFNRLLAVDKVVDGERNIVTFNYDGDGLRTEKVEKTSSNNYIEVITGYTYDRQHVIIEKDETGVKTFYLRGINYIAKETDNMSYYLYNGHGDVIQTVDEAGNILNQYVYDAFGNETFTHEVEENAIRYSGEFFDTSTGLYYLRARYYNPYIGRFISEDSYWGEDANPASLNLYTYCHNDPVNYVDPSGHFISSLLKGISKGISKISKSSKLSKSSSKTLKRVSNRIRSTAVRYEARNMSQDDLINQIDKQKTTWYNEEQGTGAGRADWTEKQQLAHQDANILRSELARRNQGTDMGDLANQLIEQQGDDAGTWETYKRTHQEKKISDKINSGKSITKEDYDSYVGSLASEIVAHNLGRNTVKQYDAEAIQAEVGRINNYVQQGGAGLSVTPSGIRILKQVRVDEGSSLNEYMITPYQHYLGNWQDGRGADTLWGHRPRDEYQAAKLLDQISEDVSLEEYVNLKSEEWWEDYYGESKYTVLEEFQMILDTAGMVPVFGEVADGVNAVIYYVNGDIANGLLCSGAMIPIVGNGVTGIKAATRTAKVIDNAADAADLVHDTLKLSDEVIEGASDTLKYSNEVIEGTSNPKIWDDVIGTADNMPGTEIPATFQIKVDGDFIYKNPTTGDNVLWTNANATEHMGEYISRFGLESDSIGIRSQAMLESYSSALNSAMNDIASLPAGRHFGTYGGWELGINTETGVIYHALMK